MCFIIIISEDDQDDEYHRDYTGDSDDDVNYDDSYDSQVEKVSFSSFVYLLNKIFYNKLFF